MAPCMGPMSPVRTYFPWAGMCPEKLVKKKIARIHFERAGNSLYCLGLHVILLGSLLNILEGFHSYRGRLPGMKEREKK